MNWKQPIPTKIDELNDNKFRQSIFQHLLLRAANKDTSVLIEGSYIPVIRGQCVVGRFEFAEEFGMKRSEALRVYREMQKLEKVNNLVNIQRSRNCSIVTILNYDYWVSFEHSDEHSVNIQRTSSEHPVNTNKNVKSKKSVKSDTENPLEIICQKFNEATGSKYRVISSWDRNALKWLEQFTLAEVLLAVSNIPLHRWFKEDTGRQTPTIFFRTNQNWIEQCLNLTVTTEETNNGLRKL